jgi:hypothetical protein
MVAATLVVVVEVIVRPWTPGLTPALELNESDVGLTVTFPVEPPPPTTSVTGTVCVMPFAVSRIDPL